jgi:hypothetical protein
MFHSRSKHINVKFNCIKVATESCQEILLKVKAQDNEVDVLAKAFDGRKLIWYKGNMVIQPCHE